MDGVPIPLILSVRVGQIRDDIFVFPTRDFQELTPNEKSAEIHPWSEFPMEFYPV
jgi:hypothetical protein